MSNYKMNKFNRKFSITKKNGKRNKIEVINNF